MILVLEIGYSWRNNLSKVIPLIKWEKQDLSSHNLMSAPTFELLLISLIQ